MRIINLLGFAVLSFCISCRQSSEKDALLQSLKQSLDRSARTINGSSSFALAQLHEKRMTPGTSYKAGIWLPKAELADKYKIQILQQIEMMIHNDEDNAAPINESDLHTLKDRLKSYADSTIAIDAFIKREFAPIFADSTKNDLSPLTMLANLKRAKSNVERATILAQLKLTVTHSTNNVIQYCLEQIPSPCRFYVYAPLITQYTHAVQSGEQVEIIAGIGSYSANAQPKTMIAGKRCIQKEDGTFRYQLTAKGKPGVYSIPVVIDYIDEMGDPVKTNKTITYRLLPKTSAN
ncbi:MAG: hypothetical protein J7527_16010 [Chitinophagaceae bacterium]|nr:hypothetical protein [Chitinophagaceae bacterium]